MEQTLPLINTILIVISGIALLIGYRFIRKGEIQRHKWSMLTATTFAALFLVVYLTRSALYGSKLFAGHGVVRVIYLAILVSHTILATAVAPIVLVVLYRALRKQYARHKRLARKALPIWLYVVVTGWLIYMMLYQISFTNT
jgi:putative membrane protein